MPKAGSERIEGLDILRTFAIAAVILIHVVSGGLYKAPWHSWLFEFYIFLDQFSRFSVPLFVFISGYALSVRYGHSKLELKNFFLRRALRLVPWYLFWSFVIFLFIRITTENQQPYPIWKVIFLGKADYHLYFVPMIFQLYLLFPLFLLLLRRFVRPTLLAILVFEVFFYIVLSKYSVGELHLPVFQSDQQQYIFFGTWVFYFLLGVSLGVYRNFVDKIRKYSLIILVLILASFAWEIFSTLFLVKSTGDLTAATRSTRIPVLLYASLFCLFMVANVGYLSYIPGKIYSFFVKFGQRSYVIYLLHTLVLRVFSNYISPLGFFSTTGLFGLVFFTSDYLALLSLTLASYTQKRFLYRRTEEI